MRWKPTTSFERNLNLSHHAGCTNEECCFQCNKRKGRRVFCRVQSTHKTQTHTYWGEELQLNTILPSSTGAISTQVLDLGVAIRFYQSTSPACNRGHIKKPKTVETIRKWKKNLKHFAIMGSSAALHLQHCLYFYPSHSYGTFSACFLWAELGFPTPGGSIPWQTAPGITRCGCLGPSHQL